MGKKLSNIGSRQLSKSKKNKAEQAIAMKIPLIVILDKIAI